MHAPKHACAVGHPRRRSGARWLAVLPLGPPPLLCPWRGWCSWGLPPCKSSPSPARHAAVPGDDWLGAHVQPDGLRQDCVTPGGRPAGHGAAEVPRLHAYPAGPLKPADPGGQNPAPRGTPGPGEVLEFGGVTGTQSGQSLGTALQDRHPHSPAQHVPAAAAAGGRVRVLGSGVGLLGWQRRLR